MCQLPKFTCGTNLKLKIIMAASYRNILRNRFSRNKGKIDETSQRLSYIIKRSTHNGTDALPVCRWACTPQQAISRHLRSNSQADLLTFCSGADQLI
jgi:hypothetical protein